LSFFFEIPSVSILITGSYIYQDNYPVLSLDAVINGFIVVAQILMLNRYVEQWLFWISIDIIQLILFSGALKDTNLSINLMVMSFLFLINAIIGLHVWIIQWKK
jgi:nicotinamide mononucleotide transporter